MDIGQCNCLNTWNLSQSKRSKIQFTQNNTHGKYFVKIAFSNSSFNTYKSQLIFLYTSFEFSFQCLLLLLLFSADKTPPGFPVITHAPQTRVIEVGQMAMLPCSATGTPTPTIHWMLNQVRLDMRNPRFRVTDGEYLFFWF